MAMKHCTIIAALALCMLQSSTLAHHWYIFAGENPADRSYMTPTLKAEAIKRCLDLDFLWNEDDSEQRPEQLQVAIESLLEKIATSPTESAQLIGTIIMTEVAMWYRIRLCSKDSEKKEYIRDIAFFERFVPHILAAHKTNVAGNNAEEEFLASIEELIDDTPSVDIVLDIETRNTVSENTTTTLSSAVTATTCEMALPLRIAVIDDILLAAATKQGIAAAISACGSVSVIGFTAYLVHKLEDFAHTFLFGPEEIKLKLFKLRAKNTVQKVENRTEALITAVQRFFKKSGQRLQELDDYVGRLQNHMLTIRHYRDQISKQNTQALANVRTSRGQNAHIEQQMLRLLNDKRQT